MTQFLLAADVDQIQNYIFGTNRMRTIRGASALVAQLGEEVSKQAKLALGKTCECLRYQGGQYVFICEKPEELSILIHQLAQKIGGEALTATVDQVPYSGDKDFSTALKSLFLKIKAMKASNIRGGLGHLNILGGGFIRHCDLCQQYPAVPNPDSPSSLIWQPGGDPGEERHLCFACWKRKKGADNIKLDEQIEAAIRTEQVRLDKKAWPDNFQPKFPAEIEQIWPPSNQGRLMGMVMADGDGIGQLLSDIANPTQYHDFAIAFDQVCIHAVARAICTIGLDKERSGWVTILPIIYGGDDFTFFLPAEKALEFAIAFGNAFADLTGRDENLRTESNTKIIVEILNKYRPGQAHLTLSQGIVAAKPNFPFTTLRRLAVELRQNAKRKRVGNNISEGMLEFAMITSSSAEKLRAMRDNYLRKDGEDEYSLTSWPYSITDAGHLIMLHQHVISEIPRSQRKFLYYEFWRSRNAAETAYRSMVKKNDLPGTRKALTALGCKDPKLTPFCGEYRERTVLLDALEIAELVE